MTVSGKGQPQGALKPVWWLARRRTPPFQQQEAAALEVFHKHGPLI
jgi:hypothetical protein